MSGSLQLQSSDWLNSANSRASFQIRMKRGWGGLRKFHIVGMKNGLLLLNVGGTSDTTGQFDGTLGAAGGLLGGKLGRALGNALEKASESPLAMAEDDFSMCSDEELIKKAKSREHKGSLVCSYDDIESVTIDKRGTVEAWTRGGAVAGVIKVRERLLGKMTWEVYDQQSLITASEFLPAKLGERAVCNLEFDRESMSFVERKP